VLFKKACSLSTAMSSRSTPGRLVRKATSRRRTIKRSDLDIPPLVCNREQVFTCIQHVEVLNQCTSSVALSTFTGIPWTLGAHDQYASFTNLFDQYRITELEFRFVPKINANSSIVSTGLFHVVVDFDDVNVLTSIGQALDYENCKVVPGYKPITVRFRPRVALGAYSGAFSAFANEPASTWLDCASTNVQYYGVKTAWTLTSAVTYYDMYVAAKLQFRNVR
jgi:hypothetical protein